MKLFTRADEMNAVMFAITVAGILTLPVSVRAQGLESRPFKTEPVVVLQLDWYANPKPPSWYCHSCFDDQNPCRQSEFFLWSHSTLAHPCRSDYKLTNEPGRDFVYRVRLRNDGPKTIRVIEWDYIFIDRATQEEAARHQFRSEEKVGAGECKTLVEYSRAPPTKVIRITELMKPEANGFIEKVMIKRVTYKDGSVCCFTTKRCALIYVRDRR